MDANLCLSTVNICLNNASYVSQSKLSWTRTNCWLICCDSRDVGCSGRHRSRSYGYELHRKRSSFAYLQREADALSSELFRRDKCFSLQKTWATVETWQGLQMDRASYYEAYEYWQRRHSHQWLSLLRFTARKYRRLKAQIVLRLKLNWSIW